MSARTATWLAWSLCALSLALTALSLLLLALNLSHPHVYIYDPWLDNMLTAISYAPVGALIASRHPENLVGWLLCLYGLVISISHFAAQYATYALLAQPDSLPAGEAMAWIVSWVLPIINGLTVFYILLFPTGRLPSTQWRWLGWLTVVFVVVGVIVAASSSGALLGILGPIQNPLGIEGFSSAYYKAILYIMAPLLTVAAALAVYIRLRRAIGVERQQIKWFAYAAVVTVSCTILAYIIPGVIDTPLVREGGVCTQHSLYTSRSYLHRDSDPSLQALRDRPHHKPHPRLRLSRNHAGRPLLRWHRGVAEGLCLTHRPAVYPRSRGVHPPDRGVVHSIEAGHTGLHRPPLLSQKVRRKEDPGSLLSPVTKRNRPGRVERRPCRGGCGDYAASPRLALAATRDCSEGRTDRLGITLLT